MNPSGHSNEPGYVFLLFHYMHLLMYVYMCVTYVCIHVCSLLPPHDHKDRTQVIRLDSCHLSYLMDLFALFHALVLCRKLNLSMID